MRVSSWRCAWFLLALGTAAAQVYPPGGGYPPGGYPPGGYPPGGYPPGGYPGGGYPPGRYPGQYPGQGPGIPIPTRGSKSKPQPSKDSGQPLPNFRGKLKQMDNKTITLELGDNRNLEFRRNDKTKFFKNGDEVKNPKFTVGDQISIEGPEDTQGYMTAVNVYWEKAASGTTTSADKDKKDDGVVDTWAKDEPAKDSKDSSTAAKSDDPDRPRLVRAATPDSSDTAAAKPEASAEKAPPRSAPDPDDPGPPRLSRGPPSLRDPAPPSAEGRPRKRPSRSWCGVPTT